MIPNDVLQQIKKEGWIYEGQTFDEPTYSFTRTCYRSPNRKFLLDYVHMGEFAGQNLAGHIFYYKHMQKDSKFYEQIACFPQEEFIKCGSKALLFEIFI